MLREKRLYDMNTPDQPEEGNEQGMKTPDQLEEGSEQGTKTPTEEDPEVVPDTEEPATEVEKDASTVVGRSLKPRESIKHSEKFQDYVGK